VKWVALFSQTGSEIETLSNKIGRVPDTILTNNKKYEGNLDPLVSDHAAIMKYIDLNHKYDLITLHGYLRIIPEDVCRGCRYIFNGHPGLITDHPELKGFNPQEKVFNSKLRYEKVGCVIHRVIPELDSGEVVAVSEVDNCFKSLEQLIGGLHGLSIQL